MQKGLIRILILIRPNSMLAVRRVGRWGDRRIGRWGRTRRRRSRSVMALEAGGEESAVRGALDDRAGGPSVIPCGRDVSPDAALRTGTYVGFRHALSRDWAGRIVPFDKNF